jgi:WD40 repeat protein/serine/threonine protein kinase
VTSSSHPADDPLPVDQEVQVDAICNSFEDAWRNGPPPRIEDYLDRAPASARAFLLRELIGLDVHYRTGTGQTIVPAEYAQRFPDITPEWIDECLSPQAALDAMAIPDVPSTGAVAPTLAPGPGARDQGTCSLGRLGSYELLQELGRGGMGVVYKARQVPLNRVVALKVIRDSAHASPQALPRFQVEAQSLARLQHPHIVQIFEVGLAKGCPYFSMEFVEGGDLRRKLAANPMPPREAAQMMETLARAVHAAHLRNIVHRDLKPANVLLTGEGVPKISDFGLAKQLDADEGILTGSNTLLGTPSYMAPEQITAAARIDSRTDVYALGAILYEMLVGRPPFRGSSHIETVEQVRTQEPVPPRLLQPKVPRDLETICLKCLEKPASRRYPTAQELADDLRRFLDHQPIVARPAGRVERWARWCRRHPAPVLAILAVVTLAAVSTAFAIHRTNMAAKLEQTNSKLADSLTSLQETDRRRLESIRTSASLALGHGLYLCEQSHVAEGLLWLTHSLQIVPPEAVDLERTIRGNLAGWSRELHQLQAIRERPRAALALAFHPDGQTLVAAVSERSPRFWSAQTGRPIDRELPHPGEVYRVAIRPDGKLLATCCSWREGQGERNAVLVWDVATSRRHGSSLEHPRAVISAIAFNPDGTLLATAAADRKVRLWNVATGQPFADPLEHRFGVNSLAFSADGKTLVTGGGNELQGGELHLWDVATGKALGQPRRYAEALFAVQFSPDGRYLAVGNHAIELWKGPDWQTLHLRIEQKDVRTIAFRPDSQALAAGSNDHSVRLWHVATGKPLGPALFHGHGVTGLAFSPDGRSLASASWDRTICLWQVGTGMARGRPLAHNDIEEEAWTVQQIKALNDKKRLFVGMTKRDLFLVTSLAFRPDGERIATSSFIGMMRLWSAATADQVGPALRYPDVVWAVAFSPDGTRLLTACFDGTAQLYDAMTGRPVGPPMRHEGPIVTIAFSPTGQFLATGGHDKTAKLWDVRTAELLGPPLHHDQYVTAVLFSPDGTTLATAAGDRTTRLWNVATRKPVAAPLPHDDPVEAIAFSPSGRLLATGGRRISSGVKLWDVRSGEPFGPPLHRGSGIHSVAFSPDGTLLATASNDRTARLWDVATGKQHGPPLEHDKAVVTVAFHPQGAVVATGSEDHTARFWDVRTGQRLGPPLRHEERVALVAFSPTGRLLATGSWDATVRLWEQGTVEGSPDHIELWTQVITGMQLDAFGNPRRLAPAAWQERRLRLEGLGGSPVVVPEG